MFCWATMLAALFFFLASPYVSSFSIARSMKSSTTLCISPHDCISLMYSRLSFKFLMNILTVKSCFPCVKITRMNSIRSTVSCVIGPYLFTCLLISCSSSIMMGFRQPQCFFQSSSVPFTTLVRLSSASVTNESSKHALAIESAVQASAIAFPMSCSPTPASSPAYAFTRSGDNGSSRPLMSFRTISPSSLQPSSSFLYSDVDMVSL